MISSSTQSKEYSGNTTFAADTRRNYFFIIALNGDLTIEFGQGGGLIPVVSSGTYEPLVASTSEINILADVGTNYVVHSNALKEV